MNESVFSKRTLILVSTLIGGSLLVYFGIGIFGELKSSLTASPDAYSYSALGHRGLVETLRKLDRPVSVLRSGGAALAKKKGGILVLLEPDPAQISDASEFQALIREAPRVLLVLPKRLVSASNNHGRWVLETEDYPLSSLDSVLRATCQSCKIERSKERLDPATFHSRLGATKPTIEFPQLLETATETSLMDCGPKSLLVKMQNKELYVFSDPDVFENHGLGQGENAAFVVDLLDRLRRQGPIVIDESLHGYDPEPSFWKKLGEFPLVLFLIQGVLLFGALLWRASGRFGAPEEATRARLFGKQDLIANVVGLLRFGGNSGPMIEKYVHFRLRAAGDRLRAPPGLKDSDLAQWIADSPRGRQGGDEIKEIVLESQKMIAERLSRASAQRALVLAQELQRILSEIVHERS